MNEEEAKEKKCFRAFFIVGTTEKNEQTRVNERKRNFETCWIIFIQKTIGVTRKNK